MTSNFTNAGQILSISLADIYTCPSSNGYGTVASSVVFLLQASNVTNKADTVTVVWTKASQGNQSTTLTFQQDVPASRAVGCLTGKLVLQPGDKIRAQCGIQQAIHLTFSALELN